VHNKTVKTKDLIQLLNPKIRGWSNYYRHVCSKKTFGYVDYCIFRSIWRWAVRRHPEKSTKWVKDKYYRSIGLRNWVFSANTKNKHNQSLVLSLVEASKTPIKRHVKIRAAATPYDPAYQEYLEKRIKKRKRKSESRVRSRLWFWWEDYPEDELEELGRQQVAS